MNPSTLTLANVLQLYAPFAGLMALAFWMGVLSQRVRHLESFGFMKVSNQITELKTKQDAMGEDVGEMKRAMEGVQRQLANISMGRVGQVLELPANTGSER